MANINLLYFEDNKGAIECIRQLLFNITNQELYSEGLVFLFDNENHNNQADNYFRAAKFARQVFHADEWEDLIISTINAIIILKDRINNREQNPVERNYIDLVLVKLLVMTHNIKEAIKVAELMISDSGQANPNIYMAAFNAMKNGAYIRSKVEAFLEIALAQDPENTSLFWKYAYYAKEINLPIFASQLSLIGVRPTTNAALKSEIYTELEKILIELPDTPLRYVSVRLITMRLDQIAMNYVEEIPINEEKIAIARNWISLGELPGNDLYFNNIAYSLFELVKVYPEELHNSLDELQRLYSVVEKLFFEEEDKRVDKDGHVPGSQIYVDGNISVDYESEKNKYDQSRSALQMVIALAAFKNQQYGVFNTFVESQFSLSDSLIILEHLSK